MVDFDMDHETAEKELRALIPAVHMHTARTSEDLGERAFLKFACILKLVRKAKDSSTIPEAIYHQTEYHCGSAIPLLAYCREGDEWRRNFPGLGARKRDHIESARGCRRVGSGISLWDDERRREVRGQYEPEVFDIVSSMLLDADCADPYDDWTDWAEDLGAFSGDDARITAEDVRKWQRDFQKIKTETVPFLRHMFGAELPKAMELAGHL